MDKISIKYNNQLLDVSIDNYKLVIGNNYEEIYEIIKAIKGSFDKNHLSEYKDNIYSKYSISFNDSVIDLRYWELFEISHMFDLNNDLKLGSKSALLKYFDAALKNIEYTDELNTLNGLFTLLADDVIQPSIDLSMENINLKANLQEVNLKNIVKYLIVNILKNEMDANYYDFDYSEIINLQLKIYNKIAEANFDKQYLCIVEIPFINEEIFDAISNLRQSNLKIMVFTNSLNNRYINNANTIIISNRILDLFNEEHVYDILLDYYKDTDLKSIQNYLIEMLNDKFTAYNTDLIQINK